MSRQTRIEAAVRAALEPLHLEVVDESHMHAVPEGAESHFKLLVVSERFAGQNLVARHRAVNAVLRPEFDTGLHALALHTWTPEEWFERGGSAPESPPCLGGSK
jgi:BolA protein